MNCFLVALLLVAAASANALENLDESKHAPDIKDLPKFDKATWLWASNGSIPCEDFVRGGNSYDVKAVVMVGRLVWQDHLLPAKVEPYNPIFSYHAMANYKTTGPLATANTYEVLCGGGVAWQPIYNSNSKTVFPSTVIEAGFFKTGEKLYVCRIIYDDHVDIGYVDPQNLNVCMYAHKGGYGSFDTYEVLFAV